MAFSLGISGSVATRLARARSRKWPDAAEIDGLRVRLGAGIAARPDWLPEIARPPEARARSRRGRVIHVVGLDFPVGELVAREAAAGWLPVACTPVQSSIAGDPDRRDGAWLLDEHGGKASRILFAGMNRAAVPADLLLSVEATLHARVLERLGCDVIHSACDGTDSGPALVGMALARRFHVAFVAELPPPVPESRWPAFRSGRSPGPSIEERMIAEAAAVIVPDAGMAEVLVQKGIDRADIFVSGVQGRADAVSGPSIAVYEYARGVYGRRHPAK